MTDQKERLSFLFLFAGALSLLFLWGQISTPLFTIFFLVWTAVLAIVVRAGALPLVGPVLIYDLIRIGRRKGNFRMRTLFALGLGLLAAWLYYDTTHRLEVTYRGGSVPLRAQAEVGQTLFAFVIIVQFFLISIMTPGYVGGAIAEEKERKTLEFLLATDLRNHEIIFGKLASRVANLLLFVLAGLPVMGIALILGGVDPDLLMLCYAVTLITLLSLSALSIFCSVIKKRARDGISFTYFVMLSYLLLTFVPFIFIGGPSAISVEYKFLGFAVRPFEWFNSLASGNPVWQFALFMFKTRGGGMGVRSASLLWEILENYTLFHSLIIFLCLGYSAWRLRSISLAQLYNPLQTRNWFWKKIRTRPIPSHPPVGDNPMYWKEVHVMGSGRKRLKGGWRYLMPILFSFAAPAFIAATILYPKFQAIDRFDWRFFFLDPIFQSEMARSMNTYIRMVAILGISVLLLRISVRSSGRISGERELSTLDELLTTLLTTREILWNKWLGSVFEMKSIWIFLISTWVIAVFCDALHWMMVPLLIFYTFLYAFGFAGLGLYCSIKARNSNRATLSAIFWGLFQGGLVIPLIYAFLTALEYQLTFLDKVVDGFFEFAGPFSPPVTIFFLCMADPWENESYRNTKSIGNDLFLVLAGLALSTIAWFFLSYIYWLLITRRFNKLANRVPYSPENPTLQSTHD